MNMLEVLEYLLKQVSSMSSSYSMTVEDASTLIQQRLLLDSDIDIKLSVDEVLAFDTIAKLQPRLHRAMNPDILPKGTPTFNPHEFAHKQHVMDKNKICPACQSPFTASRPNKKYCSVNCRKIHGKAVQIARRDNSPIIEDISRHYIMDASTAIAEDEQELRDYIKKENL